MHFYCDRPVLIIDSDRKKSNSTLNRISTYNRNLRVNRAWLRNKTKSPLAEIEYLEVHKNMHELFDILTYFVLMRNLNQGESPLKSL